MPNDDRIQPYRANPHYWQYKGKPGMLLGGGDHEVKSEGQNRIGPFEGGDWHNG